MNLVSEISVLVKKELLLEWRQKYALAGILLYVASTVFLINISVQAAGVDNNLSGQTWNVLFWMTILFASINSVTKSFFQENRGRVLYYYQLVSPQAIVLAKMIYNFGLIGLLSGLCLVLYALFLGNPIEVYSWFLISLFLGASAFSFLFSMMSAIAMKADNNATLMAILSFPLILPVIMLVIHLSGSSVGAIINVDNNLNDILILSALNVAIVAMAFILFPYLWRD